jgi:hypothetical protein
MNDSGAQGAMAAPLSIFCAVSTHPANRFNFIVVVNMYQFTLPSEWQRIQ